MTSDKMNLNSTCSVVVYCASSENVDNKYLDAAEYLGENLAERNIPIIYGGGRVGLMGRLAKGVLKNGGKITGIIPEFMIPLELGNNDVTELVVVDNMHQRQALMIDKSSVAVILPGGSGTMLEFLEIISWKRLGLTINPTILVNLFNYYDELINMLNKSIKLGFMSPEYINLWTTVTSIKETLDLIDEFCLR